MVDTNILVCAAEKNFPEHERCRELLLDWRAGATAWYLTWGIVYEFLRVTTHPQVFGKPWTTKAAWRFISSLLASSSVGVLTATQRHAQVAQQTLNEVKDIQGNLLHDAHTAVLMREHGIKEIYTRDADFFRFGFLNVVNPLAQ